MRLSLLAILILFISCSENKEASTASEKKDTRPNILFIMLDDLGNGIWENLLHLISHPYEPHILQTLLKNQNKGRINMV